MEIGPQGIIEVDLFPHDVDRLDSPEVAEFKALLEDVAKDFGCTLTYFDIDKGTVSFSFDSDELMVEILKILQS